MISIMVEICTATCLCVLCLNIVHIEVVVQVNVFRIEVVVDGNFQSKVLLRKRNLMHWELPLCSRPGCIQASKSSSIFSVCTALHRHQFFQISPVIILSYYYVLSHFCWIMTLTCAFFRSILQGQRRQDFRRLR